MRVIGCTGFGDSLPICAGELQAAGVPLESALGRKLLKANKNFKDGCYPEKKLCP